MVMGMLEAGGLEIVSDGTRVADDHNPRGYYEYERVKTLDTDADKSWLAVARGKAIKIISFLLKELPEDVDLVFISAFMGPISFASNEQRRSPGAARTGGKWQRGLTKSRIQRISREVLCYHHDIHSSGQAGF